MQTNLWRKNIKKHTLHSFPCNILKTKDSSRWLHVQYCFTALLVQQFLTLSQKLFRA